LIKPKKEIKEEDDDTAHVDGDAADVIKYIHATEKHDFLINKILD